MKKIGIVGGMGPMATVTLFRLIVENTDSDTDQGHIRILIDNNPQIPDRTAAILSGDREPVRRICESADGLVTLGANLILIPCNTAHYFYDEIQREVDAEVVNMIDETARVLQEDGHRRIGLLATTGTVKARTYHRWFRKRGIEIITPDEQEQQIVMDFIYKGVKASDYNYDTTPFENVADHLIARGAETLVLGCTELPVGVMMYRLKLHYIDSLETMARAAIVKAGYKVRYEDDFRLHGARSYPRL